MDCCGGRIFKGNLVECAQTYAAFLKPGVLNCGILSSGSPELGIGCDVLFLSKDLRPLPLSQ